MPPAGGFYRPLSESLFIGLRRRLTVILTSIVLGLGFIIWCQRPASQPRAFVPSRLATVRNHTFDGTWDYKRDRFNLMLNTAQCEQAFPGLFDEIERPKTQRQTRPITLKEINAIVPRNGYVRAMIVNQQVWFRMAFLISLYLIVHPKLAADQLRPMAALYHRDGGAGILSGISDSAFDLPSLNFIPRTAPGH